MSIGITSASPGTTVYATPTVPSGASSRPRIPDGATATGQVLPDSSRSAVLPANSRSCSPVLREPTTTIDASSSSTRSCSPWAADGEATARYPITTSVPPSSSRASSRISSASRCRSATHSASTRAGLMVAGPGWTTATTAFTPSAPANQVPRVSASAPAALPSNPTTGPGSPSCSAIGTPPFRCGRRGRLTPVGDVGGRQRREQGRIGLGVAQPRVPVPVEPVDEQPDRQPGGEPDPGQPRQVLHEVDREQDAEQREHRRERDAVRARHVRPGPAQDDHAEVDQDEREERTDVDQLHDLAERDQRGE